MAGTQRKWVTVAIGVAIVLGFLAVGGVIFVTSWARQNLEVSEAGASAASDAFDEVRRQFPGQAPLIEIDGAGARLTRGELPDPPPIEQVHVLLWAPRDEKLTRFSLPFWFLRLKSGPIAFGGYVSGLDNAGVNIRPEEIAKRGPGVIVDTRIPEGGRVLIWAR